MSRYILITFYPMSRERNSNIWLVYGHIALGINEKVGEFIEKEDAIEECFKHGVPVIMGRNYEKVLERLMGNSEIVV